MKNMVHFSVRLKAFNDPCMKRAQAQVRDALSLLRPVTQEELNKSTTSLPSPHASRDASDLAENLDLDAKELPPNSLAKNDEQSSVLDVPLLRENPGGIVHLPKSRSLITVNSSPHVHKKSREQFEIIRRAVRMEFELDKEKAEILFTLLKNMYFTGCQLAVRVKMNSYLFPTHDIETSQTSANENAV